MKVLKEKRYKAYIPWQSYFFLFMCAINNVLSILIPIRNQSKYIHDMSSLFIKGCQKTEDFNTGTRYTTEWNLTYHFINCRCCISSRVQYHDTTKESAAYIHQNSLSFSFSWIDEASENSIFFRSSFNGINNTSMYASSTLYLKSLVSSMHVKEIVGNVHSHNDVTYISMKTGTYTFFMYSSIE